jgi:hypothetical protein
MEHGSPAPSEPSRRPAREDERVSVHLGLFGSSPGFTRRRWRGFLITTNAGSAVSIAGTTGGAIGLFLEGVLYGAVE